MDKQYKIKEEGVKTFKPSFLLGNFKIQIRNLGTGRFAIPRSPRNIDIKIGIWTRIGSTFW